MPAADTQQKLTQVPPPGGLLRVRVTGSRLYAHSLVAKNAEIMLLLFTVNFPGVTTRTKSNVF